MPSLLARIPVTCMTTGVDVETTGVETCALRLHEPTGITNCGSLDTE
jgi:hypothetical protein